MRAAHTGAHTVQVSQRTLGVELAVALFEASPDPFGAASGPMQHAGTPVQQVRPCTSAAMLRPYGTPAGRHATGSLLILQARATPAGPPSSGAALEGGAPGSAAASELSAPSSVGTVVTVADADRLPEVAASCGQVCVAILAQRASDKSPAVRSKALAGLAGIVSACMDRKEDALLMQLRQVTRQLP